MAAKHAGSDKPSNEAGKSGRAGWRGKERTAATTSRFSWQQNPNDSRKREVVRKNFRRRMKLAGSALVLAALLTAFGAYLFWRAPATPLFAAAITRYAAPLPPNAWAAEDQQRIEALAALSPSAGWYDSRGPLQVTAGDKQWDSPEAALADIESWLEKARPGGPGKDAVMIYLSAHGVVDREGRPCLILAGLKDAAVDSASPHLDPARWLPVRDLVARLHKWRPEVRKLLLLDANRMEANWNIGLLYNGFAEGLDDAVREAPSVAILNSAGPGEIGWAAPELQGSAFGFFVCQGLAGDPRADGDGNGWISLQELRSYVKGRMGDWVSRRRFDVQAPRLVPADADFKLVWTRPSATAAFDAPAGEALQDDFKSAEPVWAEIGKLWSEHARLRSSGEPNSSPVWREHCRLWHDFSQGLVRCEQLALAGPAYRTDAEDALGKLREQARELAERERESFPVHSLPLAHEWRVWPEQGDAWRKSIMNSFDRPAQPPGPEARSRYWVRADAAWRWLVEGDADSVKGRLQPDSIRRILDFVGQPDAPQRAELAEMHFLRLLAGDAKAPGGSNLPPAVWEQAATHVLKALAARQAAERAAAPADERARYAIGKLVAAGDDNLRRAEDALFVARKSDLEQAELFRGQALTSYQQAQAKAELLAATFAARDRAWADLPYLAQWLARRLSSKAAALDSAEASDDLLQSTVRAIGRAHDLDELLQQYLAVCLQPGESNAPAPAELADLETKLEVSTRQLAVGLDGLAGALAQAVKQVMEQQTSDERTLRDIESLLKSPLVSGEERLSLRERYKDELVRRIAGSEAEAGVATEAAAVDQDRTFLRRVSAWAEHPALAILGHDDGPDKEKPELKATDEPPGESAWRLLARQGEDVRRLLTQPPQGAPASAGSAEQQASTSLLNTARSALSLAERRLVAGAALGAVPGPGNDDPIRRLLQFDRSELLAWQAQRRLDDCWGSDGAAERKTFYFVAAFQDCSGAARKLDSPQRQRWQDLTAVCGQREQAAQELVFSTDSKDQPRMRRQMLEKTISLKLASRLPQGTAALYVADAAGQPTEIREKSATEAAFDARLPNLVGGAAEGALRLDALVRRAATQPEPPAGKPWEQVWFYRGHRQTSEFYVRPMGKGMELVYRRQPPGPSTVTVAGEAKRPGSVVFILDCSGSMVKNDRMKKAKDALSNILGQLAVTGQYQVGLWFYGHRAGVDAEGKAVAFDWGDAARKRWWGEPLSNLLPSDDLQRIVSLAPLDRESVKDFQEAVATAWPYGRTPLYRAIVEVVNEDLARQPRDLPRRLVVITDGQNEVTGAGDRWSPRKGSLADEEDVKQCFAGDHRNNPQRRIQLDILGVEVPNKRSLETMLGDDRIRGKYYDVGRAEELEHVLENALGLYKYSVARMPRDGADEMLGEKTLGETFEIEGDDVKDRYRVRLVGTKPAAQCEVDLQSREAIALAVSQASGQWRLRHEPYQRGQQTEETAVSPHTSNPGAAPGNVDADFNPAEFYVAAHRPEIRPSAVQLGKTVAFPISFQNADRERFSPRPAEAWVEIAPVFAASQPAGEPYRIFDLSFEPQRPVPVLDCVAPDWPADARNAQIRVWFKLTRTKPSKEVSLGELETEPGELRNLHLPGAPDAQFGLQFEELADGCQLAIDEEHPLDAPIAEWVRVESRTPPDEIRRTYNHEGRFARHLFLFRGKSLSQIRGDKLQLTTRADLQAGAAAVTEPLRVTIHD